MSEWKEIESAGHYRVLSCTQAIVGRFTKHFDDLGQPYWIKRYVHHAYRFEAGWAADITGVAIGCTSAYIVLPQQPTHWLEVPDLPV